MNLLEVMAALFILALSVTFGVRVEKVIWQITEQARSQQIAALEGESGLNSAISELRKKHAPFLVSYQTSPSSSHVIKVQVNVLGTNLREVTSFVYDKNNLKQPVQIFHTLQSITP